MMSNLFLLLIYFFKVLCLKHIVYIYFSRVKDLSDDLTRLQQELADARQNNEELDRQRRSANSDRVATQHKVQ